MVKPIEVKALEDYKLWVKFDDGVEGEVDLLHLAGRGVFSLWNDYQAFQQVYIGSHGEIAWNDDIDIGPDTIYMKITGQSPEDLYPNLRTEPMSA